MSEENARALWGIETPDSAPNPPTTVAEKIAHAVRLGILFNACDWSWRQAALTGDQASIDAGDAALAAVIALLPEDSYTRQTSAQRIQETRVSLRLDCSSDKFHQRLQSSYDRVGMTIDGGAVDTDARLTRFRERQLKPFATRLAGIRTAVLAVLNEREKLAFQLGVVLDRGIRPSGIRLHLPLETIDPGVFARRSIAPPPPGFTRTPPVVYLGNCPLGPGDIAPEPDWIIEVAVRWRAVFDDSLALEGCLRGAPNYLVEGDGRRELVSRLVQLAVCPPRRSEQTPTAGLGQLAAQSGMVSDHADPNPFPLQFDDSVPGDLRVFSACGGLPARFFGKQKVFDVARCVFEHTVLDQPALTETLHAKIWPKSAPAKKHRNALARLITDANALLWIVSCEICPGEKGFWMRVRDPLT